jgi:signal transduction histidine kinase
MSQNETCRLVNPGFGCNEQLPIIQTSLQQALQEMRSIAAGFGLPQLESLTLAEIIKRVVRSHEQRTGTKVALGYANIPEQTDLPTKIALYRFIQEALTNAHKHAGGVEQHVQIKNESNNLLIEVSDQGPGFNLTKPSDWDEHLGLSGMRERVESLGGLFKIESVAGLGTKVIACLPLQPVGEIVHG